MSKRNASNDLNHDNWDEEGESEEAGTFKQANESELKGRVIKRAKRRNINAEERTNVFSGFSGFSSTSTKTAVDVFSFLSKSKDKGAEKSSSEESTKTSTTSFGGFAFGSGTPTVTADQKPATPVSNTSEVFGGFVFGNAKPKESAKPFGGFVFGSSSSTLVKKEDNDKVPVEEKDKESKIIIGEKKETAVAPEESTDTTSAEYSEAQKEPVDDLKTKFKAPPGNWSCPVCMISNNQNKSKCVACETSKPIKSGVTDDLFNQFKAPTGNWSCSVCLISNSGLKSSCAACETPKPGAAVSVDQTSLIGGCGGFSLGEKGGFKFTPSTTGPEPTEGNCSDLLEKFKPKIGSWSCDVCMITNEEDKSKCVACETPKPGNLAMPQNTSEKKSTENTGFSFGENGGFKFISGKTAEQNLKPFGGFNGFSSGEATDGMMEKFKPKEGSWDCDVCMLNNTGDKLKCVACETPKPGASSVNPVQTEKTTSSGFSFGSNGGFKFSSSASTTAPVSGASTGGFNLTGGTVSCGDKPGVVEAEDNACVKVKSSEFSFGVNGGFKFTTNPTDSSAGGGFTGNISPKQSGFLDFLRKSSEKGEKIFGSDESWSCEYCKNSNHQDTEHCFSCNKVKPALKSPLKSPSIFGGFSFKPNQEEITKTSKGAGPKKLGTVIDCGIKFGFNSPAEKPREGFSFGVKKSPLAKDKKRGEYLGHVKALNLQVTNCMKKYIDTNPLVDFSPVFEDYRKHMASLREKYGYPLNKKLSEPERTVGNGSVENCQLSVTEKTISPEENVKKTCESEFTVDEAESYYSTRCKLFYKKDGKYVEKGMAVLYLKTLKDNKRQLLIRSANMLGTILLNSLLMEGLPVERLGPNNVLLACMANPPMDKDSASPTTYLVRVKTAEAADILKQQLEAEPH